MDEPKNDGRTRLGRDLDALVLLVKRAAAMGAVAGFFHHFLHRC